MNIPSGPFATSCQVHSYTELRQQIHDDLRLQHPEWVEQNGESSMRLLELLEALTQRGETETTDAIRNVGHNRGNDNKSGSRPKWEWPYVMNSSVATHGPPLVSGTWIWHHQHIRWHHGYYRTRR